MKKLLAFLMCLWLINTAQAQKIIFQDNCEALPVIQCAWCTSKTVGWTIWTAGTQDVNNQASTHTIKALASGEQGAPAPRKGSKCYQFKITRLPEYFGSCCQWTRNELKWGDGCDEFTNARWFQTALYLPSTFCDDQVPHQILYDMKFGNAQGPASFGVSVEDGNYSVYRQANQGSSGVKTNIGPVDKGIWVDWVCERNFKDDASGFIRLYKQRVGIDNGLQLVYSYNGANYNMSCGPNSEAYLQNGLYKWAWQDANNQNEGPSSPCGYDPIIAYYDEMKFWNATATLADLNADVSGGGGPPANQPPLINAGVNQTIILPDADAVMAATTSDPDGVLETLLWIKVSGPAGGTISNNAIEDPTITALQEGTYVFRLTGTDDDGASTLDEMTISVQPSTPPPTTAPIFTDNTCTMELGHLNCPSVPTPDQTIQLPVTGDTVIPLAVHQNDGYVQQFAMVRLTGPNTPTINQFTQFGWIPSGTNFGITGMIEGVYTFKITVTDNEGTPVLDTMSITVVEATNASPTVNAGADQTLTLDGFGAFITKSTTLNGTATDSDGSIASLQWQVLSGPENSTFGTPTNDTTIFAGLIGGIYVARLTAIDNDGAQSSNDITVRVLACNAGVDQTVQPLITTTTLVGTSNSVTDTTDVLWTKISGTGGSITSSGTLTTGITGLTAGTYVFELTVTHTGGYVVKDRITVTVLPGNVLPTVNAGTDITLALDGFGSPTTQSTTLRGTDSDSDGSIATATWSIVSGPAGSVFGSPTNDTTTFTNLIGGTYIARLTVVDDDGGSSFDDISVRVITVSAGADQGLPSTTTSVTLTAISNSVSDTTDVLWTKISGTGGTITSNGVLSTTVTGLTIGAYVFQVQVTHVGGYITKDQVAVNISATEANNFYKLQRGTP